jgi:hypothetical protein
MKVSMTWRNDNPSTIWSVLVRKLGREPTNAEAIAELNRIRDEVMVDMAGAGKLPHQRGRSAA